MLSAIAARREGLLWLAIQGGFILLSISASKGWRYLIEGQRQRALERITSGIRPGVEVELKDRRSSLHVRGEPAPASDDAREPPPGGEGTPLLVDIVRLDTHRQIRPSEGGWAPPA
jgi:hypothetical protein